MPAMPRPLPLTRAGDGIRLDVRVTPRASADCVSGIAADADGRSILLVRVAAVPESGKANAALIRLLAKGFGLPKSAFSIARGAAARHKVVHVCGDTEALAAAAGRIVELRPDGTGKAH